MAEPARRPATYADVLAAPPGRVAELVAGALYTHPRPASRHARAASSLGGELHGPFDRGSGGGPGGWVLLDEPELHLGGDVVVPDLGGWRRARMPELPDAPFFELAPDWVCEVLSPSTAGFDRDVKLPVYARAGVPHVWLVDPGLARLEVLRLGAGGYRVVETCHGDEEVRCWPFEAVALPLGALWRR
jgi:Uma2 family endonuclease